MHQLALEQGSQARLRPSGLTPRQPPRAAGRKIGVLRHPTAGAMKPGHVLEHETTPAHASLEVEERMPLGHLARKILDASSLAISKR